MSDADEVTVIKGANPPPAAPANPGADEDRTVVRPRTGTVPTGTSPTAFPATMLGPAPSSDPSPDNSLLVNGSHVAEFEVMGLIGQGGFGVVYRAWDHALEREVAIKEYYPSSLATRQGEGTVVPLSERHQDTFDVGMRSFVNEARLLAQFDHPSLLKVYRFWQENGTTYMVMPLYKGNTLKSTLSAMGSQVDEKWLLGVMDGVTQALGVMHQANCYHRDIAPDNILLLEGSGLPVVLDFGAARRVISDMTQAITVILKPGYAPIEQYDDMPGMSQGAWTDVYALGAVMHVAVCGRPPPPSVGRLMEDRYVSLANNEVLRQRFSQKLLSGIDAALSVRPEARPQSMAELRSSLGIAAPGPAAANAAPPLAQAAVAPMAARASSPASVNASGAKSKAPLLAAVGGVVVLAAAAAWWMTRPSGAGTGGTEVPAATAAAPATTPNATTPAAAPALPFDAARTLHELSLTPAGGIEVIATPRKETVAIAKDKLEFTVRANRAGFVYVFMLSSGGEMYQMFPNQLDRRNQIKAGETLSLPRPSWPMEAGGPAGVDRFVVMVSEAERDFTGTGIQNDGIFGQYSMNILSALEAARAGRGPSTLLGKVVCPAGSTCSESYGATEFKITEQ